jgi:uncharacterized protein YodC (DUF2158 family)
MAGKFKPGDVVQLWSGSPNMTVESYKKNRPDTVNVVWFAEKKVCSHSVPESALRLAPEASGAAIRDQPGG